MVLLFDDIFKSCFFED